MTRNDPARIAAGRAAGGQFGPRSASNVPTPVKDAAVVQGLMDDKDQNAKNYAALSNLKSDTGI